MAIVTLEDLQGTIEVVVFPRLYEQTGRTWREGAILLVAGRVDHKGEEVSLLADLVRRLGRRASAAGAEAFAREVAAGDRGRRRPARPAGTANGNGNGSGGHGRAASGGSRPRGRWSPVGPGRRPRSPSAGRPRCRRARRSRSSRRGAAAPSPATPGGDACRRSPRPSPSRPTRTPPGVGAERRPRRRAGRPGRGARPDRRPTRRADAPVDAGPDTVLHVRFAGSAPPDRVVGAMEAFKAVCATARARPGSSSTSRRAGGGGAADGAAPRRRLRRRAARRGPAPARRRPGGPRGSA